MFIYLKLGNRDFSSKNRFSFPNDPDKHVEPSLSLWLSLFFVE